MVVGSTGECDSVVTRDDQGILWPGGIFACCFDAESVRVLQGLVKQREDSVFHFRKASRPELVRKEEAEIEVLKEYLPAEASDADIGAAVDTAIAETGASSPKDMGRAIKAARAALEAQGKPADGKRVSDAVRKRLGG